MAAHAKDSRTIVGTMTGTSMDGLDAAVIRVEGSGRAMRVHPLEHAACSFPAELARQLRAAAEQQPMTAGAFAALALELGLFHADALAALVDRHRPELLVLHGQTVFHAPPVSWQLLNPAPVVERFRVPVVCDLRQVDLAAGGQGAPITPLADWMLFRACDDRAIVNLGGFCNATLLPADAGPERVRGFDICACNQILDAVARQALGQPFDEDGRAAARGRVDGAAHAALIERLLRQRAARRSLGTGDEAFAWVEEHRAGLAPNDLAATAASAVGSVIGMTLRDEGMAAHATVLLAGGGARHPMLAASIGAASESRAVRLDSLGIAIEAREAIEMAVLGALAADGEAITLPQVTGSRRNLDIDRSLSASSERGVVVAMDGAWWRTTERPGLTVR